MKIIKSFLYGMVSLILAACLGVLVCAFNPSLTSMLGEKLESLGYAQASGDGAGGQQSVQNVSPGVNASWLNSSDSYRQPTQRPANPPDSVSGRNGYEPVREDAEQIPEEEAENLSGILAPGNTGSGLDFSAEYYPYYAMLESDMQQLYSQIYANALSLNTSFTPVTSVSVDQLKTVFEAVYNDHPELFWLETEYSCKYLRTGSCVEITLRYNDTADDRNTAKRIFDAAAEQILSGARTLEGDYNKERYVHDALMQITVYDETAPMNQSAYSALVNGRSVCAGYARAFQYLMRQLNIPCYYCTGYAGEDHAWDIVRIGDTYYNADITWDDTDTPTYDYFNKTDNEIAGTHMRTGLSVYLPACVTSPVVIEQSNSDVSDWINPNPSEPLTWHSKAPADNSGGGLTAEERKQANLEKAGITEDQVRETMKEYYEDCLKLLKEAGPGDKQFSNVIPESLWNTVERAYSSGAYWDNYVKAALKEFDLENCVLQLQVQRLGGGYYRIYHNVYTY